MKGANLLCEPQAVPDALARRDAASVVADKMQSGMRRFQLFQRGNDFSVSEVVLRDGARPSHDTPKNRIAPHTEERRQILAHQIFESGIREGGEAGLPRPSDKGGEKNVRGRRSPGKKARGKNRAENAAVFRRGDENTEAVKRMPDLLPPETLGHDAHWRILDAMQDTEIPAQDIGPREPRNGKSRDRADERGTIRTPDFTVLAPRDGPAATRTRN